MFFHDKKNHVQTMVKRNPRVIGIREATATPLLMKPGEPKLLLCNANFKVYL